MYNKVEICGVNTAKLKVLTEAEKHSLLQAIKHGPPEERAKAREEMISGNLKLVLSVIQRFTNRGENLDDLGWTSPSRGSRSCPPGPRPACPE